MNSITVLHICYIDNNKCNGVSTVVPKYYLHQKKLCNVGILNCTSTKINSLKKEKNLFLYDDHSDISELPQPFNKPDLVVFHEVYKLKYVPLYKRLKKYNIPYIIIPHGCLTDDAQKMKKIKKKISNCLLFNRFIKNALSIQFLSSFEKDMSKKYARKCFVAGNGVDVNPNVEKSSKGNITNIVYIGRYSIYHKGIDLILDYCRDNKDLMQKNNIVVNLYGSGKKEDTEKLYDFVKKYDLSGIVSINGPLFDEKKIQVLDKCDYFIQLSRLEGQPLGLMEALANGVPVIVSDGTTFGDYVKNNNCGFICNSSDSFSEILRIVPFLSKKEYDRMSSNAVRLMKERFDWDIVSLNTVSEYNRLASIGNDSIGGDK